MKHKVYAYILLPDAFPVTNSLFIRFVERMEELGESTSPTSLGCHPLIGHILRGDGIVKEVIRKDGRKTK